MDFEKHMDDARKRVAAMDRIDGVCDRHLATICAALEAGLKRPETGAQFDALVMLLDVKNNRKLRTRQGT